MLNFMLFAALLATPTGNQAQQSTAQSSETRATASVAQQPNVMATISSQNQNDLCAVLDSAAYGSPVIGLTFDVTRTDKNCGRLRNAKFLVDLGLKSAAIQLMCQDVSIQDAMLKAGTPCKEQR